jgi:acetyl-CoA C-acetyltransferase
MEQRMSQEPVLIIDGARTPMGGLLGSLSSVPAPELASTAVREALKRSAVNGAAVDEIFMGCVLPAGLKQCPARQAAIGADIPTSTGAVTKPVAFCGAPATPKPAWTWRGSRATSRPRSLSRS